MHRNPESNGFNLTDILFRIYMQVCFCQNDDGIQTAVVDKRQTPFNAPQVKITVQTANDEHGVQVCCDNLFPRWLSFLFSAPACSAPGQSVFSWQNTINHIVCHNHPIPCDGILAINLMVESSCYCCKPLSFSLADIETIFPHTDHSGGFKFAIVYIFQVCLKKSGPPQR